MYEILYIIPAPFTEKDVPNITKKMKKLIEEIGGQVIKEKSLGNKKLAYPIKQVYRGFYELANFEIDSNKLNELDKKLKLTPEILRHMIIQIKPRPVARPTRRRKPAETLGVKTLEKETLVREKKEIKEETGEEKKEDKKKRRKIDLKGLGKKIDELFKI